MSKLVQIARTVVYYTLFLAMTILAIAVGGLHSLWSICILKKDAGKIFRLNAWRYGKVWGRLSACFVSVSVTGYNEALPSPCIVILNHQSVFDPYCLGFLPERIGGRVNFWVTSWPFSIPVFGMCMRTMDYIDITRLSGEECIAKSKRLLDSGVSIAVFPEGTRSKDGELGMFRIGVFKLALEANVPVIPVVISGLGDFAPKGRLLLGNAPVRISILPPILPRDVISEDHLPERALSRRVRKMQKTAIVCKQKHVYEEHLS